MVAYAAASSGTYVWNPTLSEVMLEAFERCGIRANALSTEQLQSATRSMNYVNAIWTNRGVNLWRVSETIIPLIQGTATYAIDPAAVDVLAESTFLRQYLSGPNGTPIDILIYPLSRGDYVAIPDKTQQGRPTSYWFDRTLLPQITVWPVPDGTTIYELHPWIDRRMQDANPAGGETGDMPQRFYEAYAATLAAHLSMKWAPERAALLAAYAQQMWQEASDEDREKAPLFIAPSLAGYFD